jgi:hypothetical protein
VEQVIGEYLVVLLEPLLETVQMAVLVGVVEVLVQEHQAARVE